MLIATSAFVGVHAEETEHASQLINLYDPATATKNAQPGTDGKKAGDTVSKNGEVASAPIVVSKDQYIYVGPCPAPTSANISSIGWVLAWYKSDGSYTVSKKILELEQNVVGTFEDGSVIYKIKVNNKNYKYAALRTLSTYFDYVLMTVDQPFTVEDYYAYADARGWNINSAGLRPSFAIEAPQDFDGIWNLFPREEERDPFLRQLKNTKYVTSHYIPVSEGDTITMGAISMTETHSILYTYDTDFQEIDNYTNTDVEIELLESLDYGFAIYSCTIPQGVSYIKVCVHSGIYNDGDILVTRNQPFGDAQLREALNISELSSEAKEHAFYNQTALFVGDSISYGSADTPPTYRNPSASWARRLALATGLIPVNVSRSGASVGKTYLNNITWEYELLKTEMSGDTEYNMIVFQGGVNDARQNVAVGEALPADTDIDVLKEEERITTFAGGLQLMFHDAKERWPDATLYYISTFKVVPESVNGKDMGEYYAQAEYLCNQYGVHYINLYDDSELYKTFDYESTDILPDLLHPNSYSYDVLFPAILRLFNETIQKDEPIPPTNIPTTPTDTPTDTPITPTPPSTDAPIIPTVPPTDENTIETDSPTPQESPTPMVSMISIICCIAVIGIVLAVAIVIIRWAKKKKNKTD